MAVDVQPVPRPEWSPVPREGCRGVEGKVLLRRERLAVAMLRFAPEATIDEHAAAWEIDVVCLEGEGMTSVDGEAAPLRAGQRVRWPAHRQHRLWTEGQTMVTLMLEHLPPSTRG